MESRVVRDITGKLYDIYVVCRLDNLRKQYSNILEITYLPDFADTETFEDIVNLKYIIRNMLITYLRNICDIYKQPDLLQVFIFTFLEEGENVRKFEFSNNMMFSDDITTICLLYYIITHDLISQCETVQLLLLLMKNKYGTNIERKMRNTESTQEQDRITLYNIGCSYPSIMWNIASDLEMYSYLFKQYCIDFDLPKSFLSLFFLPSVITIFPTLNQVYPFAIVMIIVLKSVEYNHSKMYNRISLRKVLCTLSSHHKRQRFPEHLKLELCKKWQIMVMEEGTYEYKYTPCFIAFWQKAKDILATLKPNDPDLEFVLSQL